MPTSASNSGSGCVLFFLTRRGCKPHPNQLDQPWVRDTGIPEGKTLAAQKKTERNGKREQKQMETDVKAYSACRHN
ncbi:hypothetical protein E2C01_049291 [Portunus trituberculatus]|uniref:Uncharacterized protein n=1 Tax=Portunus trituberculatus TaxID=210409 RepID=A0A5B7GDV6_PORTR|nr:hypothetical protein [Portunus trituberculatus]